MRRLTWFCTVLILGVGFSLFQLKYKMVSLEKESRALDRQCNEATETIHVLKAEWEHLNDPKRLQQLSERYLVDLHPVKVRQISGLRDVISGDLNYDRASLDALMQEIADDEQRKDAE